MMTVPIVTNEATAAAARALIESRIEVRDVGFTSPCWVWTRGKGRGGYGQTWFPDAKATRRAHRVAYEAFVRPIPPELVIDHLCRNPSCVNPAHLEPVTNRENLRRGEQHNNRKTHCIRGHAFTDENTYIRPDGYRQCRACNAAANATYNASGRQRGVCEDCGGPTSGSRSPRCRACHVASVHRDVCKRGHALTDESNLVHSRLPARVCKACHKIAQDAYRSRLAESAAA